MTESLINDELSILGGGRDDAVTNEVITYAQDHIRVNCWLVVPLDRDSCGYV